MKKVLFILMAVFIMACGRSENYDMKGSDFLDKIQIKTKEKKETVDAYWELYYNTKDTTKQSEYQELINKENSNFSDKYLEMDKKDYSLFLNGMQRYINKSDTKSMKELTVGEIIDAQKQIEGK